MKKILLILTLVLAFACSKEDPEVNYLTSLESVRENIKGEWSRSGYYDNVAYDDDNVVFFDNVFCPVVSFDGGMKYGYNEFGDSIMSDLSNAPKYDVRKVGDKYVLNWCRNDTIIILTNKRLVLIGYRNVVLCSRVN